MCNIFIKKINHFIKDESGNEAVELAVLFPIILLIVGFILDRFIQYEGVTSVTSATNEAMRYAIVADGPSEAKDILSTTLGDRFKASGLAWCTGNDSSSCDYWKNNINVTTNEESFKSNPKSNLLIEIDDKGWCLDSYITVGVRAHKASVFPSYESFQHLMKEGGPIYHTHTYIITARIETNNVCE